MVVAYQMNGLKAYIRNIVVVSRIDELDEVNKFKTKVFYTVRLSHIKLKVMMCTSQISFCYTEKEPSWGCKMLKFTESRV